MNGHAADAAKGKYLYKYTEFILWTQVGTIDAMVEQSTVALRVAAHGNIILGENVSLC